MPFNFHVNVTGSPPGYEGTELENLGRSVSFSNIPTPFLIAAVGPGALTTEATKLLNAWYVFRGAGWSQVLTDERDRFLSLARANEAAAGIAAELIPEESVRTKAQVAELLGLAAAWYNREETWEPETDLIVRVPGDVRKTIDGVDVVALSDRLTFVFKSSEPRARFAMPNDLPVHFPSSAGLMKLFAPGPVPPLVIHEEGEDVLVLNPPFSLFEDDKFRAATGIVEALPFYPRPPFTWIPFTLGGVRLLFNNTPRDLSVVDPVAVIRDAVLVANPETLELFFRNQALNYRRLAEEYEGLRFCVRN